MISPAVFTLRLQLKEATDKLSQIFLDGASKECPACGRQQGYIYDAGAVRQVLIDFLNKGLETLVGTTHVFEEPEEKER